MRPDPAAGGAPAAARAPRHAPAAWLHAVLEERLPAAAAGHHDERLRRRAAVYVAPAVAAGQRAAQSAQALGHLPRAVGSGGRARRPGCAADPQHAGRRARGRAPPTAAAEEWLPHHGPQTFSIY